VTQPSIGDLIYLASYVIKLRVSALSTPPDTPNQYTADLHVMGDQGAMSLDPLTGPQGPGGLQDFAFRQQDDALVNTPADLPTDLTDTPDDIGKYWLIDTLDSEGVVTKETAWTWYGTGWREFQMGVVGVPGAVPDIQIDQYLIDPTDSSYVKTTGASIEPSWGFHLAEPAGPAGPPGPLALFPDTTNINTAVADDLLAYNGTAWTPFTMTQLLPGPYSMPEGSFTAFSGITQEAGIGTFTVPARTYDWTPIVWGHIGGSQISPVSHSNAQHLISVSAYNGTFTLSFEGATTVAIPYNASPAAIETALQNLVTVGAGNVVATLQGTVNTLLEWVNTLGGQAISTLTADISNLTPANVASVAIDVIDSGGQLINDVVSMLSGDPLMIGVRVTLPDGTLVARGLGSTMGIVTIMPHYSGAGGPSAAITPTNEYAMIPAGQAATLTVSLWNDGKLGLYDYQPGNSQIFVMATPVNVAAQLAGGGP
jgi:hypothetical protein